MNRWTYFTSLEACYQDSPRRRSAFHGGRAVHADYWTNSGTGGWIDPHGGYWGLVFVRATNEFLLIDQVDGLKGPAWVSRPWPDLKAADKAMRGYRHAEGSWDWLVERLGSPR